AEHAEVDKGDGTYIEKLPGDVVTEPSAEYRWRMMDYGGNEVITEMYEADVDTGVTLGYSTDFETDPGWVSSYNSFWERGVPTSGPEGAISGENVYATVLDGNYSGNSSDRLMMPPVELPDGDAFLQFKHWYMFESGGGDIGEVQVSTDQENWDTVGYFSGQSGIWQYI